MNRLLLITVLVASLNVCSAADAVKKRSLIGKINEGINSAAETAKGAVDSTKDAAEKAMARYRKIKEQSLALLNKFKKRVNNVKNEVSTFDASVEIERAKMLQKIEDLTFEMEASVKAMDNEEEEARILDEIRKKRTEIQNGFESMTDKENIEKARKEISSSLDELSKKNNEIEKAVQATKPPGGKIDISVGGNDHSKSNGAASVAAGFAVLAASWIMTNIV